MQRTDESGSAYGEDPYRGAGYADTYGYEHGGSAPADTATVPWAPEQLAQEAHPTGHAHVARTDPYTTRPNLYVIATDPYAAGPHPATAGWDAPHGDVLTVPPPELDPSGPPAPGPGAPKSQSVRPVFVDSSGRRQRRVLRAAQLLVIPAGGYVALLISALLGGPTLNAPFVPQPDSPHPTTPGVTAPDASSGTGHSAGNGSPAAAQTNSRPTPTQRASGSTDRSAASAASAAAPVPTAASTGIASPTSTPTASATPVSNPHSKGRAVGSSHNPVK
ncbi:hypothetical protein ABZ904_43820 [Streptomyces sp. NPDC046900]|uniref:hypothetical protein n=1 Tax=Streptomyces sp. NPDC046900 TaxID=3155473 RepID=UPI0033E8CBF1